MTDDLFKSSEMLQRERQRLQDESPYIRDGFIQRLVMERIKEIDDALEERRRHI